MRPKDYGFRTVKTGNKPHPRVDPVQTEIGKKFGLANGYKGEAGGWIYDKDGQHIAHGWAMFALKIGWPTLKNWAVSQGIYKED